MAEVNPDLKQRYLKEQQEYLDAVSAYEQTLNRVAGSMLSPVATQTNYSVQSEGYKRAATDPWMSQNHPDLAAAANRLAKEEGEYRALDDPSASHGNNKCSIANYTAEKFYEYVAAAEMLYLLATDENFRKEVVAKVGELFERGGAISDFFTVLGSSFAAEGSLYTVGNKEAYEANQALVKEGQEASLRLVNRLKAYFSEKWQAFKKGWEECGLANAVARAGIDGLFLAGEILIGGAAIRGIKFAYALTKEGLHRIEIIAVDKALTVGERSWSKAALEDKYGKPEQNQVAGLLEDQNRAIKDGPAQSPKQSESDKNGSRPKQGYTQKQLDTAAEYGVDPKWVDADGKLIYPTAAHGFPDGFDGPIENTTIKPGELIDRYGSPTGKFFSTPGTPFEQRAMALSNKYNNTPRVYKVLKEIPVQRGRIAPWFDQPGGGIQYLTEMGEQELIRDGYIEVYNGPTFR